MLQARTTIPVIQVRFGYGAHGKVVVKPTGGTHCSSRVPGQTCTLCRRSGHSLSPEVVDQHQLIQARVIERNAHARSFPDRLSYPPSRLLVTTLPECGVHCSVYYWADYWAISMLLKLLSGSAADRVSPPIPIDLNSLSQ
jgi:hypothetical protein